MNFALDMLRHLFCLGVIVLHMYSASRYSPESNQFILEMGSYVGGVVCGFFMISGYLFKIIPDLRSYAFRQAKRLLIPFFVFSVTYAVLLSVLGKSSLIEGLKATAILHGSGMQLYFLPYLALITLSAQAGLGALPRTIWPTVVWAVAAVMLALAFVFPTQYPTGSDYRLIPFYGLAFLIGVILQRLPTGNQKRFVGPVILAIALASSSYFDHRFLGLMAVSGLLLLCYVVRDIFPDHRLAGSGGVYLMHTPIINFGISTILVKLGINNISNFWITVVLTYIFCLIITLIYINVAPRTKWLLLE